MRILCAFAVAGCLAAPLLADEWSKRFEVTGQPELRVQSDDASVTIRAGASRTIDARLTTRGWSIGPDGVRVIEHQTGNSVEIEVRVPHQHFSFGNRSAHLELLVPDTLRADIRTGDGQVTAENLKGELRLTTGDGAINAESVEGTLEARTGDGGLTARGRFDRLDLHTNDGAIVAAVHNGSKVAGPWRIETGDGSVSLRLPNGFAADLDAQTGDGGISVHLPISTTGFKSGENNFRGKLNGGGLPLRIRTGDGAIRIEPL